MHGSGLRQLCLSGVEYCGVSEAFHENKPDAINPLECIQRLYSRKELIRVSNIHCLMIHSVWAVKGAGVLETKN